MLAAMHGWLSDRRRQRWGKEGVEGEPAAEQTRACLAMLVMVKFSFKLLL